jgi:hypothetical protein
MEAEEGPPAAAAGEGGGPDPRLDLYTLQDLKDVYRKHQEVKQERPQDPAIHFYKGLAMQLSGQKDPARRHYANFRRASVETFSDLPSAISRLKVCT